MDYQARLNRYETAQEALGFLMALHFEDEEAFAREQRALHELRFDDDATIERVLREACPLVKREWESVGAAGADGVPVPDTLPEAEREAIWRQRVAAFYQPDAPACSAEAPLAIITGGQPGAGKSGLAARAAVRLGAPPASVLVDADKLRPCHPHYLRLMRQDARTAANRTHADCIVWAQRLQAQAIAARRPLIIDQTSRTPDLMQALLQRLHAAGYHTEWHLMAVPAAVSTLRVWQRYESQRAHCGFGRFSTPEKHDDAYAGVAQTVTAVQRAIGEGAPHLAGITLYGGDGQPLHEWRAGEGECRVQQALQDARQRPMTADERVRHAADWHAVLDSVQARGGTAEETAAVRGYLAQALQV